MATCTQRALPRSIDVTVNVTKPQVARLTNFSKLLVATTDAPYDHGLRIKSYVSTDEIFIDFDSTQEVYKAARDFFAQSPRPLYMLVGRVFTEDQPGIMETRTLDELVLPSTFAAVTDGEFTVSIDGDSQDITGLDFSSVTDFDDVAAIVQVGVRAIGSGGFALATVVYSPDKFIFNSGIPGDGSAVSSLTITGGAGTDISGTGFLNGNDDPLTEADDMRIIVGYSPVGVADELELLDQAGQCGGNLWYGLVLTREFRDTADTLGATFKPRLAAEWAQGKRKLMGIVTNDILSLSADITSDIGSDLHELGQRRSVVTYADSSEYYPDVSSLARLLSVDFNEPNGVITMKFKDLPGLPTVNITSNDLTVLLSKRINTFTRIQTDIRTFRDGVTSSPTWYMDEVFNIDGLVDRIETEVYNTFLRNDVVPFSKTGRLMLEDAINRACYAFTVNGALSARDSTDPQTGDVVTEPAYTVIVPLAGDVPVADRADRKWSGIKVIANLSGAVHSCTINLDALV